jgi:hypothetical protein
MTQVPAGWHPAPDRPGQLRYWDGQRWTDHYAPAVQPPLPGTGPPGQGVAPTKPTRGGLIAVLVIVLLLGGCMAIAVATGEDKADSPSTDTGSDDDAPDPDDPDVIGDDIGAQVVCQDFVERQLKAPSTADFGDEEVEHIRGPVWEVVGEVDSENSFGAMIRNNYVCRVKFTGDDNWQLVKLTGLTN